VNIFNFYDTYDSDGAYKGIQVPSSRRKLWKPQGKEK
jgi:hypothetical protein